tara:strand:- start:199 stop:477 length:279 start_codon:yes stop_codon:yes gene_type:complete
MTINCEELECVLQNTQVRLETERFLWSHERAETKALQRLLLSKDIAPLLSDAIDFLEVETPSPSGALKRIKAALKRIEDELGRDSRVPYHEE